MKSKNQSPQLLRKRKFLILLPLLVLPFLTLLFWALGGGDTSDAQAQQAKSLKGLNMELPNANNKEDMQLDKLSYYEKAATDSARLEELMRNDPYYSQRSNTESDRIFINDTISPLEKYSVKPSVGRSTLNTSPYSGYNSQDANEAKVYKKLEQLNAAMSQTPTPSEAKTFKHSKTSSAKTAMNRSDIERLEKMMIMNKQENGDEDPEMKQLTGMMEKILDIQHPERLRDKIRQTSEANKGKVFAVSTKVNESFNSLLTNIKSASQANVSSNRFYSLDENNNQTTGEENAIKAVVHQSQILVDGSIIKLRLLTEVFINGNVIPKDHFVFGTASLNGERLVVKISSIRHNSSLYPVDLSVCDLDGIEGIYIPGAITRDVAKQSADRAVQGIGITTFDPSIKVQAASAGIEAAKTLMSKKSKLVKVTVKAGYQVLIRDEKQK